MKLSMFFILLLLSCGEVFASEPDYILRGRAILSQWGEIYCIKKYVLQGIDNNDVNDSLHLFDYSDRVSSLIYSDISKGNVFYYIDKNISDFGNLVNGKRLNLIACVELVDSVKYIEFIKKQDRYFYQNNAGVGSVIRSCGQKIPFGGYWRMISRYGIYESRRFKKGDIFPAWKSNDGFNGGEWILESRDDGGPIKLDVPYFKFD
ncbi:hypothetical protein [Citrobacter freundii]|uniref:hypothetical protein n=2 Tax=Citrobacter freundii TaxID=546 RepID=UPI001907C38C|nr:hypothetical protein [Citrobacter freundii]EKW0744543.1 hypothetical protein [Citrobacter freundii]ELN3967351.1 hypothetical protein [Citrobacter freundii]MBJ9038171.1 hypothetical protein [Citrobacter freundii]MBQ0347545.1 hypothetical protein [Citrobacter freundii]WQI90694.1 hypothetical protein R5O97_20795 [Citrobacter freundii]